MNNSDYVSRQISDYTGTRTNRQLANHLTDSGVSVTKPESEDKVRGVASGVVGRKRRGVRYSFFPLPLLLFSRSTLLFLRLF